MPAEEPEAVEGNPADDAEGMEGDPEGEEDEADGSPPAGVGEPEGVVGKPDEDDEEADGMDADELDDEEELDEGMEGMELEDCCWLVDSQPASAMTATTNIAFRTEYRLLLYIMVPCLYFRVVIPVTPNMRPNAGGYNRSGHSDYYDRVM